jgi:starch-binding outer membrane protein, SusD/RagB family
MNKKLIFSIFILFGLTACKKFVDVGDPKNSIPGSIVYSTDATAKAVMNGIYSKMISGSGYASGGPNSITLLAGLSADEFRNFQNGSPWIIYYTNTLTPLNSATNLWSEPYNTIGDVNALIEGLENSNTITDATKKELLGEAKFVRAFCYFYLTNLFGEVPLITSSNYKVNALAANNSKNEIYSNILSDLKDAQTLLAPDYSFGGGKRVVPNQSAATALLARVYLFLGDWPNAEAQATIVINNPLFQLLPNLSSVFLGNSSEAIWQLMPTSSNTNNTNEGGMFIPASGSNPTFVSLSSFLLTAFESGDNRRLKWVDSTKVNGSYIYYPGKYKVKGGASSLTEYSMVLRLAEQYLIRAEAKAQQNNIFGAQSDLNMIRLRAGLANTAANDKSSLLAAILHERQVELFTEWGHRWLDLKRTNTVDAVMSTITPQKGGVTWQSFQQLYPIPQSEILNDPNLHQNSGY